MTVRSDNSAAICSPAIDDLRRDFGDRWDNALISGGYRALIRDSGARPLVPLYGRTPAELVESIGMAEDLL